MVLLTIWSGKPCPEKIADLVNDQSVLLLLVLIDNGALLLN